MVGFYVFRRTKMVNSREDVIFFFTYLSHLFFDNGNTYLADVGSLHY